jgi:hypothetical protein
MATLRMKVLPKFPAQVLAGSGITITQAGGTYTFSVDTSIIPALDADLTAIAALNPTADKSVYWTAADSPAVYAITSLGRSLVGGASAGAMLTTLGISAFAQTILDDAAASNVRTTLGLGTSATVDTGTSGTKVPLLDGANTFSAAQIIQNGPAGLTVSSGGSTTTSSLVLGRTGTEIQLGVVGVVDTFYTGTVLGDVTLKASGGGIWWIGGSAGVGIKISSSGVVSIRGTTTNDSAAAGFVGELIESEILVGSAVSQTTGTSANITSISLTAGDWDVFGNYFTNMAGGTTTTNFEAAIHTTSATLPTRPNKGAHVMMNCSGVGQNYGIPIGTKRLSLSGTTTVYLVASANFSGSTLSGYGYLGARRVR